MALGRRLSPLLGRGVERDALDRQLKIIRGGRSSVLVLRGEPGIGKTALLEYMLKRASGCRVVRAAGVQSEMELAFAGLHQLCASSLDRIDRLADPQRAALATAFGLCSGAAPNPFLVGLATLSLFTEVSEEEPLVCVVDDAQWLDRASRQALGFVARRLFAEPVALMFTTREQSEDFARLPELVVEGLDDVDARVLLRSVIRGPLDEMVRERIVAETRGNPLALVELPRGLTPAELAGGFGLPDAPALSGRIEESFGRRVEGLAVDTQRLLLVAAAEPVGDPLLVWRAAQRLGIGTESAAPAAKAGLLELGANVRFCHPLARSAVYRAASPEDRRSTHDALAEVTDPAVDPDRRAWHRAQATAAPSEDVASELERSASRARGRGGVAAAAAFLERATDLTPDPARRAERALAAAYAKHEAGAHVSARGLLGAAKSGPLDELQRARAHVLDGQIAFAVSRGSDAAPRLLEAAKQLELLDPVLARETYAEAFAAAMYAGRLAKSVGVVEVAKAARAAKRAGASPQPARTQDLLLDGQALLVTERPRAATPMLKRALSAVRGRGLSNEDALRWLWLACITALQLWDDESWRVLSDRYVQLARDAGALTVLPLALNYCAGSRVCAGEFAAAEVLGEEARGVSLAIANPDVSISSLNLAGWRGRQAEALELIGASDRDAAARGEGRRIGAGHYAAAVLYNGLGRYQLALAAAQQALEYPLELATSRWALPEQIEAAARSGQPEPAALALRRLSESTRASGTDWAVGIEARARALLSDGEVADGLYREAINRLRRTRVRSELARAHLLYGEWLRRENRRLDARDQLRTAHTMLTRMGAEAFADRAARELLATGETVRKRTSDTAGDLTAQEAQIARMARDGASNRQIAAQLFISHKTVEYHLRKVFAKLSISTRADLAAVLAPD
jgi:DNA-binding CsgD family transcriptional regulator/tetratricopeptide (TPR) repeat protein